VISSTFLSLVVVPVFYLAIENLKARLRRKRRSGTPPLGADLPPPVTADAAE
jgi:hypothetical protein